MITLPDFKEKQILFIQIDIKAENKIKFSNENILFLKDNKIINRASCHKVFVVFVIGDISITTVLLREASKYGISMFFMKNNFLKFIDYINGEIPNTPEVSKIKYLFILLLKCFSLDTIRIYHTYCVRTIFIFN